MKHLILGTAGHIDHGKTALVRALTGVETDRLREEQERGITIDLGFAALEGADVRVGLVDVPGHEGYVRNMLAGATGMDAALVVVAADEGIMPQTREHLGILEMLAVPQVLFVLTKIDRVEPDWLELVRDDLAEFLAAGPWPSAAVHEVSSLTGEGIEALREAIVALAAEVRDSGAADEVVLPVDRVFSVRGTGSVVTGSLLSGELRTGSVVHVLPEGLPGRVRALQQHGAEAERVGPGSRVAVALSGERMDLEHLRRGQLVVTNPAWRASSMLTVELRTLPDTGWSLRHGQRVRLHLGTDEVMARVVLFDRDGDYDHDHDPTEAEVEAQVQAEAEVEPGSPRLGQLRTERPVAARSGQRFVVRSYSPVATIGGGEVIEPLAPRRTRINDEQRAALERLRAKDSGDRIVAVLDLAGWAGADPALLPVQAGVTPAEARAFTPETHGALALPRGAWVGPEPAAEAARRLMHKLDRLHAEEPWWPAIGVDRLRAMLPDGCAAGLADAVLAREVEAGRLELTEGRARRPGHEPTLTPEQERRRDALVRVYREAGLTPPLLSELPEQSEPLPVDDTTRMLIEQLQSEGRLARLDPELWIWSEHLDGVAARVGTELAGGEGLGPADFREIIPVTRKHLLPILTHLDVRGVTVLEGGVRRVFAAAGEQTGDV